MKNSKFYMTLCLVTAAGFVGCTQKDSAPAPQTPPPAATTTAAAPAATPAAGAKVDQTIEMGSDGDNLAFNKTSLEVKAGSTVKLTYKNNVKTSGLSHNWVLAKPGTETDVANDGMQAGEEKGWVAEGPNVLAHTKLIKPGDSDTITFVAPPAGDYPYICTYPGHGMTMKGVLHSK